MQRDKQRSTKHTHKTKDRVARTPLKPGVNSGPPEGSAVPDPHVNLVINSVISHELGKDREVVTTSRTYPWSFVT